VIVEKGETIEMVFAVMFMNIMLEKGVLKVSYGCLYHICELLYALY
jgi:hypothetical protein